MPVKQSMAADDESVCLTFVQLYKLMQNKSQNLNCYQDTTFQTISRVLFSICVSSPYSFKNQYEFKTLKSPLRLQNLWMWIHM